MSTEARMKPQPLEQLRSRLKHAPSYDFLSEYVTQVVQGKREEDIFRLLALRCANFGSSDADHFTESDFWQMYETLRLEDRNELRREWHERIRREAYSHGGLSARLSWRYLV